MQLTFMNRLRLCYEIIACKSGHNHKAQEKQLSTFIKGYKAGYADAILNKENN